MQKKAILIVEDDANISNMLKHCLEKEGYLAVVAESTLASKAFLQKTKPDLLLLDWRLPGQSGLDYLQELKLKEGLADIPVIMLTARNNEEDVSLVLDSGAVDFIAKPFRIKELLARIRSKINTNGVQAPKIKATLEFKAIRIEEDKREVYVDGQPIVLSRTEFDILLFLIKNPGIVFERSQIIQNIKGEGHPVTDRVIDVQIAGLRRKLKQAGKYVVTIWGVGYKVSA